MPEIYTFEDESWSVAEEDLDRFMSTYPGAKKVEPVEVDSKMDLPEVSAETMELSEKFAIAELNKTYKGLGFIFEQDDSGMDKIKVTSPPNKDGEVVIETFDTDMDIGIPNVFGLQNLKISGKKKKGADESYWESAQGLSFGFGGGEAKKLTEFIRNNSENSPVNVDVYSKVMNIANEAEFQVDGKKVDIKDLTGEELTKYAQDIYANLLTSGVMPGVEKVYKQVNEELEPFTIETVASLQKKYDVSNPKQLKLAQEELGTLLDTKQQELLKNSSEFNKINEGVLAALETRFGGEISDKLRDEAEKAILPNWVNSSDSDVAKQGWITTNVKLPKSVKETSILSAGKAIGDKLREIEDLKKLDPNARQKVIGKTLAGSPDNKSRIKQLESEISQHNTDLGIAFASREEYQEKLNNLRVPTVFGKTIDDPDLTIDEWQGMLGDQAVQMVTSVLSLSTSTFVQEAGGAAMDIIEIETARRNFPGLGDDAALKSFRQLPAEDTEKGKGRITLSLEMLNLGQVNLNPAVNVGMINMGLDLVSNVFVASKALKFVPKSLGRDLLSGNIKKFLKGGWKQGGKDIGQASLVEMFTETAQEATSMEGVNAATGYLAGGSRISDQNTKRLFEAGAQALLATGPLVGGGKVTTSAMTEARAEWRAMVDPDATRNAINNQKAIIENAFKNGDLTLDERNEEFTLIEAEEDVMNSVESFNEMTVDAKEKVVDSRVKINKNNSKIKEIENTEKGNFMDLNGEAQKIQDEIEINKLKEENKENASDILTELRLQDLQNSAEQFVGSVNSSEKNQYNGAKVIKFTTKEEARKFFEKNNMTSQMQRLLNGEVNAIQTQNKEVYSILEWQIENIKSDRYTGRGFGTSNAYHHDVLHVITENLSKEELTTMWDGIVNSFIASKDPKMLKINELQNKLFESRYGNIKKGTPDYYLEKIANLSDVINEFNLNDLNIESGTTLDAISKYIAEALQSKSKIGNSWNNFDISNALEYLKSYTDFKGGRASLKTKPVSPPKNVDLEEKKNNTKKTRASEVTEETAGRGVYDEINDFYEEYKSTDSRIAVEISASMMQGILVGELLNQLNSGKLKGFSKEDIENVVLKFTGPKKNISGELKNRGLVGLIEKYEEGNKRGADGETVPLTGYLNSIVKGQNLILQRLDEFVRDDPNYGRIIKSTEEKGMTSAIDESNQSLSPEEIMIKKEQDKKDSKKPSEKRSDLMLYNQFEKKGVKEVKEIHEFLKNEYKKLYEGGKMDKKTLKDLKNLGLDKVQEMFGVSPKPGNLTGPDVKASQIFIKKLGRSFFTSYVFINHFTKGVVKRDADGLAIVDKNQNPVIDPKTKNKATGLPGVLQVERPTSANGLQNIRDKFYEPIGDRKNLKLKRLKEFDDNYFYKEFGIVAGDSNLYKKSDNISQTHFGIHRLTLMVLASQAAREVIGPGAVFDNLQDGLNPLLYSEVVRGLDIDSYIELLESLPEVGIRLTPFIDDYKKEYLTTALKTVLNPKIFDNKKIQELSTSLDKILIRYVKQVKRFKKLNKQPKNIVSYLIDSASVQEQTLLEMFDTSINKTVDGKLVSEKAGKMVDLWNEINEVQRVRDSVKLFIEDLGEKYGAEKALRIAFLYLNPMFAGASKIGDGKFTIDKEGRVIENDKWTPTKINKKGKTVPQDNRKQAFENIGDFINNGVNGVIIKGKKIRITTKQSIKEGKTFQIRDKVFVGDKQVEINTKSIPQGSQAIINKIKKEGEASVVKQGVKESQEAQEFIQDIITFYKDAENVISDNNVIVMMLNSLNSNMKTAMRRAAGLKYVVDGYDTVKKPGQNLEYEHMIPANWMMIKHVEGVFNNTVTKENLKEFYKEYKVAIIPKTMDTVLKESGYNSTMPSDYVLGQPASRRYYNDRTLGKTNLVAIRELGTQKYIGKVDETLSKKFNQDHVGNNIIQKAVQKGRASEVARGITILDFDDTLATSKSLIRYTIPGGGKGTLTPEQYASTYESLLGQGYKFDFSEFNKVVDGKTAPLFQKALKLQEKFGNNNMFVLTARPAEAAPAIYEFLKANGLNIPLKNITGLANSTAEAKALWVAEKVGEGYNDFYFADDALQNVQAVDNMLNQFDVKRKVQQAKLRFSEVMNEEFNKILENITGIESKKRFEAVKARKRGKGKGKFRLFVPPSHEDFVGLLYNFMGKGKDGNAHREFLEQALIKPLNRANKEYDTTKQSIANDYKNINKDVPQIRKRFNEKTPDGDFIIQDAIRIYLWDKHGHEIPGLSSIDQKNLVELAESDESLRAYADAINIISKQEKYIAPTETWESGDIRIDLIDAVDRVGRAQFFKEFVDNAEIIFSQENLNKIEAAFGAPMVSAIKDMLYRIKTGRNRPAGSNAIVNRFVNFLNGSVGTVMFFNVRSMLLQQLSNINYINFADNNIYAAGKAFANQKQYWSDFAYLFNSDFMKQRRSGIQTDVNGAELYASINKAEFPMRSLITKLLQIGFAPTQIADNVAIATGGASYYRNRVNKYLKDGLKQKEAENKAWEDFQEITETNQQSARPNMVSQQQASAAGKFILNFQNTPSQYVRIPKKSFLDVLNRRITPPYTNQFQSDASNISRIAYYLAAQNLIFYGLQSAMFMVMFSDEEEDIKLFDKKRERIWNGMLDTVLRGSGIFGGVLSTIKNMGIAFYKQRQMTYNPDESSVVGEMLNLSPVIGIKVRKIVLGEKELNYNKKLIPYMSALDINNPVWGAATNYVEGLTNLPVNRIYNKTLNVSAALDSRNTAMQRVLLLSGYSTWSLGIKNTEQMKAKYGLKYLEKQQRKYKKSLK